MCPPTRHPHRSARAPPGRRGAAPWPAPAHASCPMGRAQPRGSARWKAARSRVPRGSPPRRSPQSATFGSPAARSRPRRVRAHPPRAPPSAPRRLRTHARSAAGTPSRPTAAPPSRTPSRSGVRTNLARDENHFRAGSCLPLWAAGWLGRREETRKRTTRLHCSCRASFAMAGLDADEYALDELTCPITGEIFLDPVLSIRTYLI